MKVRKSAALAGAAVTAAAASALIAVPAFASPASSASAHTITFISKTIASHGVGEVDKDVHNGKFVAYDVLNFVSSDRADVALGLKGGFLYGTFTLSNSGVISGHVTGGTGAYRGDRGTIRGQGENNGAHVTVTYWR
jgi:hypothetical protein